MAKIKVNNISKSYQLNEKELVVLNGLSLEIPIGANPDSKINSFWVVLLKYRGLKFFISLSNWVRFISPCVALSRHVLRCAETLF